MKVNISLAYKYALAFNSIKNLKLSMAVDTIINIRDDRIKEFFLDPTIHSCDKSKILTDTFSLDEKSRRFFEIIFKNKRFNLLKDIKDVAESISMRAHNVEKVMIRSAIPLNESDKSVLYDTIKNLRKVTPVLIFKADPSLIAGIVIDFDDSMIDLSISGTLKAAASFMFGG